MDETNTARVSQGLEPQPKGTQVVHGHPTPEPDNVRAETDGAKFQEYPASEGPGSALITESAPPGSGVKTATPSAGQPAPESLQSSATAVGDGSRGRQDVLSESTTDVIMHSDAEDEPDDEIDDEEDLRADPNEKQQDVLKAMLTNDNGIFENQLGFGGGTAAISSEKYLEAVRNLAVAIHPRLIKGDDAGKAWQMLKTTAAVEFSKRQIPASYVEELEEWDGPDYTWRPFSSAVSGEKIDQIYKEATNMLGELMKDPDNKVAKEHLQKLNADLPEERQILVDAFTGFFRSYNDTHRSFREGKLGLEECYTNFTDINRSIAEFAHKQQYPSHWHLDEKDFMEKAAHEIRSQAEQFLSNPDARATIQALEQKEMVLQNADPQSEVTAKEMADIQECGQSLREAINNTQMVVNEVLNCKTLPELIEASRMVEVAGEAHRRGVAICDRAPSAQQQSRYTTFVRYGWKTGTTMDDETIIGYIKHGKGYRLLVEKEKETKGHYLRYYISGSEAGSAELEAYKKWIEKGDTEEEGQAKNLQQSEEIRRITSQDNKENFSHILWFPQTTVKCYNKASGHMKSPAAHFPAMTKDNRVLMISMTGLRSWIGSKRAVELVGEACGEIGIVPPWNVEAEKTIDKPERLMRNKDKNKTHGMGTKEKAASIASLEARYQKTTKALEDKIAELSEMVMMLTKREAAAAPTASHGTEMNPVIKIEDPA